MTIKCSRGDYPIEFLSWDEAWSRVPPDSIVVTDTNVVAAVPIPEVFRPLVIPAGEPSKSLGRYEILVRGLAQRSVPRNGTVVALGGGVVGDLAGFVAATYMRGVDLIQMPTSLLAMVDSSIGGKVGIDLPEGKNLVGAFHPPKAVLIVLDALETLPERHRINGMAEVLKMGFIRDPELLNMAHEGPSRRVVERALRGKQEIVEADEFEKSGLRATLNFGHTIGHAIETLGHYETYLHGEAIAIGMVLEAEFAESVGTTERGTAATIRTALEETGLPTQPPAHSAEELIEIMARDKKADRTSLSFAFVEKIGSCKLTKGITADQFRGWWNAR